MSALSSLKYRLKNLDSPCIFDVVNIHIKQRMNNVFSLNTPFDIMRVTITLNRDELMRMLAEDELREAVLLIFANKQDLPNAMNAAEITDKLGLHSLRNRNWYIQVRETDVVTLAKSMLGLIFP